MSASTSIAFKFIKTRNQSPSVTSLTVSIIAGFEKVQALNAHVETKEKGDKIYQLHRLYEKHESIIMCILQLHYMN